MRPRRIRARGAAYRRALALQGARLSFLGQHREHDAGGLGALGTSGGAPAHSPRHTRRGGSAHGDHRHALRARPDDWRRGIAARRDLYDGACVSALESLGVLASFRAGWLGPAHGCGRGHCLFHPARGLREIAGILARAIRAGALAARIRRHGAGRPALHGRADSAIAAPELVGHAARPRLLRACFAGLLPRAPSPIA